MKKTLPLADIIRSKEFQIRSLDKEYVQDLQAAYEGADKDSIPPPRVWAIAGRTGHFLTRGFHRMAGADKANLKRIEVEVKNGTVEDAFADALSGDLQNGKRFTNKEKKKAAKKAMKQFPKWTSRKIADLIGVSHTFVSGLATVAKDDEKTKEFQPISAVLQKQLVAAAKAEIHYPMADKWLAEVTHLATKVVEAMADERRPPDRTPRLFA